ncbi:MAG: transcriptional regulator, partial [Sulfitobacter sp.]|nr:transcriptional regulator [Sulfitobacter sp.]
MGSDVSGVVEPILCTKLHRPQLDANLVDRGRLIESMNSGLNVPLTLVSAPAGYGKSALVARWAEQLDQHIAWLSLDASDSKLSAFLQYFISAVDTIAPGACNATRELLQAESVAPESVLAAYLLNELDAIDTMSAIVLDDYHRIETLSPVQDLMLRMLEHPPRRLRFIVLTRQDPPFDLSSLRAAHCIREVRLQDLRFTAQETRKFLSVSTGLSAPDEVLEHLERVVEGWPVGLRLVSLALRHARNREVLLKGLPELLPDIQEYLLREVLAAQPAGVRDRMLASAILDRFCAEVLDAVYEPPDTDDQTRFTAADFLQYLRKSNLFTVPLDVRHEWFRYHHLFQEMLVTELQHLHGPEHVVPLHLSASEWFEDEGLIDEALRHALAAGDKDQAADLVVRHRNTTLGADQWSTLTNWLSLIPETIVWQRAELLLARAWIHLRHLYLFEPVPELLEQAESLLDDQPVNEALQGELALCRGFMLWNMGEGVASLQLVDP